MADLKANPAPLGLMGFGMTTILLNLHNAGLFGLGSMILGMGIFYGGLAQVIAGIMEYKNGNTFGTVAFTSYGLFWLSLVALWAIPKFTWGASFTNPPIAVGFYLLCWGIFTLMMFFGTLKANRALQFVFASLALLFFLLAAGDFTGNAMITQIAGYEGIICGASAFYLAMAEVLNLQLGKTVLPIGTVKK
ncbi:MAG: acetate uptake transporter [Candidatus Diapherotrites archaeon]|nr:acetate uptake transporter [Candidatus Diapherotrites archaeon]